MLKSAWAGFTTSGNASAWANQFKSSDFYTKLYSDAMQTRGSSYSYESLLSGNTVSGISSMAKIGVSNTISGTESDLASLTPHQLLLLQRVLCQEQKQPEIFQHCMQNYLKDKLQQ